MTTSLENQDLCLSPSSILRRKIQVLQLDLMAAYLDEEDDESEVEHIVSEIQRLTSELEAIASKAKRETLS